ncbi:MAG: hypothetical protein OXH51_08290 [Gemmatimonadetes bacterium]|nr:hypothetical protein [Gemmatimonadota bacterium]
MNSVRSTRTVAALATLAAIQFSLLADQLETGSDGHVAIGDDLSGVRVGGDDGRDSLLGEFQLVLVFDPECAHSGLAASKWEALLRDPDRPGSIVAVAPGSFEAAARHAAAQGWQVTVATVDRFRPGSREHALVSRTPWVFALQDGRVVAQGHGDELAEVVAALSPATRTPGTARPQFATVYLP